MTDYERNDHEDDQYWWQQQDSEQQEYEQAQEADWELGK